MEILDKNVKEATQKKFNEELEGEVTLIHFSQEPSRLILPDTVKGQECMFCKETKSLISEVASLSSKINLEIYDFLADEDKAAEFGIDKIPATVVIGEKKYQVRFFGIPSGYEYASLLEAIIDVSRGKTSLSPPTKEKLATLKQPVHIQVFITPTCPYCPLAVRLAHQAAIESPLITGDMIEATEFPHLAQKYNVTGVPKTIINDQEEVVGAVPESVFLEALLEAASATTQE
ncbi:MAG: thioredoxin family protein [Candidatus Aminicenantes bacterium]|nr:thioredoxin family protein [Candidatus Aminicenantes bacterium]